MTSCYAVSVHDVAPATWQDCARLLELLAPLAVPVTLLIVPHYHGGRRADADPEFSAALRERVIRGDEVMVHGYYHRDTGPTPRTPLDWGRRRLYTAGEGEFGALGVDASLARIRAGRDMLAAMGLTPHGFVAPAWLLGPGAWQALRASGLGYTCTRDVLVPLADTLLAAGPVAAPSLVYSARSSLRRALSRRWNARRLRSLSDAPRVRAALHPADARHPDVLGHWRELLEELSATRRPALESEWLRSAGPGR
ncbi:MAG TPA: polysaccharide deacetylase family protein [Steroidobacteraceae bacterium]|nr:polysaccharide deacetylase family protein [Steroidobacteraceae bacterium]